MECSRDTVVRHQKKESNSGNYTRMLHPDTTPPVSRLA